MINEEVENIELLDDENTSSEEIQNKKDEGLKKHS